MNYARHKQNWIDCTRCDLCETRRNVVLLRGTVPAPILFCGEAPGESEDVLGKPFVGPAGKLLDSIIQQSEIAENHYAITNLIACIPKEDGDKISVPPKWAVEACKDRLNECVKLVNPYVVIWVGQESKKWGPKIVSDTFTTDTIHIVHPAAILRMNPSQQGLAMKRCIVAIADIYEEVKRWIKNE